MFNKNYRKSATCFEFVTLIHALPFRSAVFIGIIRTAHYQYTIKKFMNFSLVLQKKGYKGITQMLMYIVLSIVPGNIIVYRYTNMLSTSRRTRRFTLWY